MTPIARSSLGSRSATAALPAGGLTGRASPRRRACSAPSWSGPSFLGATVVAPDEGALGRCRAVAEAAGIEQPVAFLRKQRTPTGVVHGELVGHVGRRAVIIDDILDTGETLVSCCRELRRQGVEDMIVMVTHGLFTGEGWKTLPSLGVSRIYATDSVPSAARRAQEGARLLSVRPLLEQAALRLPDDVEPARP